MENIRIKKANKSIKKNQAGFSFVELLVSVAIFGVILFSLNAMLNANTKVTQNQSNSAQANIAARQSLLRISDIVIQAQYIYPANQILELNIASSTKTIVTGKNAIAVLLPQGTTYCPGNGQQYCGYVISVEERSLFNSTLGNSKHASDYVLAGWRAYNLNWDRDTNPSTDLTTWLDVSKEVLIDSIVAGSGSESTDLASINRIAVSKSAAAFDDELKPKFSNLSADKANAIGLIASISPKIVVAYDNGSGVKQVKRNTHIYARAIPRGSLPNPE